MRIEAVKEEIYATNLVAPPQAVAGSVPRALSKNGGTQSGGCAAESDDEDDDGIRAGEILGEGAFGKVYRGARGRAGALRSKSIPCWGKSAGHA